MISRPLTAAIIIVVTVVFTVNFLMQFFIDGYQPDPAIYGLFLTIVGGALGLTGWRGNGPGSGSGGGGPP